MAALALITFVKDRPGHDRRYAIDAWKIERELGWRPRRRFETGMGRPCAGTWRTAGGAEAALSRGYGGERLGSRGGPV